MLLSFIIAPSITSLEVTRLNTTTFNLSASLAYTGGGAITHFRVSFRNTRTTSWTPLENVPVTSSPDSSLVWNGVMNRDEFNTSVSLTFQVLVVNAHGLVSAEALVTFAPGMCVVINKSLLLCVYHPPPISSSSFPATPSSPVPTVAQVDSSTNSSMPSSTPTISTGTNT